jgi:hypothetical protein
MWPARDDPTRAVRLCGPKDGSKKEDTTMADPSEKKRNPAAVKAIPQHEVDARLLREKAARLKELRLTREERKRKIRDNDWADRKVTDLTKLTIPTFPYPPHGGRRHYRQPSAE